MNKWIIGGIILVAVLLAVGGILMYNKKKKEKKLAAELDAELNAEDVEITVTNEETGEELIVSDLGEDFNELPSNEVMQERMSNLPEHFQNKRLKATAYNRNGEITNVGYVHSS